MIPTYVNLLFIYSVCNIHDFSVGEPPEEIKNSIIAQDSRFKALRSKWVLVWVFTNTVIAYFFNSLDEVSGENNIYTMALLGIGFLNLFVRWIGAVCYAFVETCKRTYRPRIVAQV